MDQLYEAQPFDPLNEEHEALLKDKPQILHRWPGKLRASDFGLDHMLPNGQKLGLDAGTELSDIPRGKGLSCFDLHIADVFIGACHVVDTKSLYHCFLEIVPTEMFVLRSNRKVKVVHWVVRPRIKMTVKTLEKHWNYPRRPILVKEVALAKARSDEPDPHPRRAKELERAIESLKKYDSSPQILSNDDEQLLWVLCQIAGSAESVILKHRLFDDPSLQMVSLALRSFTYSDLADDNDRQLAFLLHYSFGPTNTAVSYSKPNALSAPSRNLIYRSLENLLLDKDEFDKHELDELDEQRLRWLMALYQPIKVFCSVAEGHSTTDQIINDKSLRALSERSITDCISTHAASHIPSYWECSSEIVLRASVDFLLYVAFPASFDLQIKTPFTVKVGDSGQEITIERLRTPSFLLEEPDCVERQHFHFKDAGITPSTEVASDQHPVLIIDEVQSKEEDLVNTMSHLGIESTLLRGPIESEQARNAVRQSVQCSAIAVSKKRQCKNRTLHPSGKCHVHISSSRSGN